MRIVSLASGSKGNAYVIEQAGVYLLVDCGLNYKTFKTRWAGAAALLGVDGSAPPAFLGVLVTHSHTDHTAGLKTLLHRQPDLAVYANAMTAETVLEDEGLDETAFVCFENGQDFVLGPFTVHPFSIPHDTSDPVGYLVRTKGETYFHGTDIGTPLASIGLKLAAATVATLESNHDAVLLRRSGRPPSLIQRIAGPRGHLSNDQAADLVERYASPKLKRLALAHLSQDCNAPHLAEGTMRETLAAMKRTDIRLSVLGQDTVVSI